MFEVFERDMGGIGFGLGLLVGLVIQSILLFGFERWLHDQGGWPLLIAGLVAFWSAVLASLMLLYAVQKRRRDRLLKTVLAEIRAAHADDADPAAGEADER